MATDPTPGGRGLALREAGSRPPGVLQSAGRFVWRLPRLLLIGIVRVYQGAVSPLLGPSCRFTPTCSSYAVQALTRYGAVRGTLLAVWRILRCHPWGGHGYDPPRWFGEAPVLRVGEAPDDGARNATSGERV